MALVVFFSALGLQFKLTPSQEGAEAEEQREREAAQAEPHAGAKERGTPPSPRDYVGG